MRIIHHSCDGCGRSLGDNDAKNAELFTISYANALKERNTDSLFMLTDEFCETCQVFAYEYWEQKPQIMAQAYGEANKRIERHRRTFFQERKAQVRQRAELKLVKVES